MRKSITVAAIFFIFLTTYKPNFNYLSNFYSDFNIKEIIIENNLVLESIEIKKRLNFVYSENLFFFNIKDIEKNLQNEWFIDSFSIKKIYSNILKIKINEKIPVAILHKKKKKFYISEKGDFINFRNIETYNKLPIVFGDGKKFYSFYNNLLTIKFPIDTIRSFYFFESGRWDLVTNTGKVIKLPIKNYLPSVKNFMQLKSSRKLKNYKIFDYRIKNQLILN